jgi:hypothetical protein
LVVLSREVRPRGSAITVVHSLVAMAPDPSRGAPGEGGGHYSLQSWTTLGNFIGVPIAQ